MTQGKLWLTWLQSLTPVKRRWPARHQTPHAELALTCCSNTQPGNRNVLCPSEGKKNLCCKQTANHSPALPPRSWQSCSWPHATLRTNTGEVSSARLSSNKDVFMACLRRGKKKKQTRNTETVISRKPAQRTENFASGDFADAAGSRAPDYNPACSQPWAQLGGTRMLRGCSRPSPTGECVNT